jgi:mRNA-binding protein PUF3
MSRDQLGSRYIQGKLETATSQERETVFEEIKPAAVELMEDVYGNYVIQRFFERGDDAQKDHLVAVMKADFFHFCTHVYACRVVQTVSVPT